MNFVWYSTDTLICLCLFLFHFEWFSFLKAMSIKLKTKFNFLLHMIVCYEIFYIFTHFQSFSELLKKKIEIIVYL